MLCNFKMVRGCAYKLKIHRLTAQVPEMLCNFKMVRGCAYKLNKLKIHRLTAQAKAKPYSSRTVFGTA